MVTLHPICCLKSVKPSYLCTLDSTVENRSVVLDVPYRKGVDVRAALMRAVLLYVVLK